MARRGRGEAGWGEEVDAFVRAFAGAWLFGIPLLFTMEMWWIGRTASWTQLLVFAGVALGTCLGLNYAAGFKRSHGKRSLLRRLDETVDAFAVGLVAAAVTLLVIGRIGFEDGIEGMLGMIILQAVPLSIGASFANHVFRRPAKTSNERAETSDAQGEPERTEPALASTSKPPKKPELGGLIAELGVTAIGGAALGVSIAPTDEVLAIATGLDTGHLFACVAFSLSTSYAIVFASGFGNQPQDVPLHRASSVTAFAYAVSLGVALFTLALFDVVKLEDGPGMIVRQVLVMGIPTTMGGAAGRLLV